MAAHHAGQMRGAAGAGDDDLVAGAAGALGEGDQPVGRAVGRDDAVVMGDAERIERVGGVAERRPVGLAAHDDGDRAASGSTMALFPLPAARQRAADYSGRLAAPQEARRPAVRR